MKGKPFRSWVLRVLGLRMLRMQEVRRLELTDRSKSYKHPEPICGAEGIPPPPPPSHLCRLLFSPCSRLQGGSSWACQHPPRHPTPPPERRLCSAGSGGDGEEQVPLLTGEGAGEVQPRIKQEPSLHPCYLAKRFSSQPLPLPSSSWPPHRASCKS